MSTRQREKGFTIIEVVLVLAIAGLIFMMVFIALPALQRSQRDSQRKNDLNRLVTALSSYQSNNRGALPSASAAPSDSNSWSSFVSRYVTTAGDTFDDPSTGTPYGVDTNGGSLPETFATDIEDDQTVTILVTIGSVCDGENLKTNQGNRKVAFQMKLEGNGIACQNN